MDPYAEISDPVPAPATRRLTIEVPWEQKAPWDAQPAAQPATKPATGPAALFSGLEQVHGLPPGLLDSVWSAESGRGRNMLSSAGAQGHFQFMPGTAARYGLRNPNDLAQSATAAAKYYGDLLQRFDGDISKAVAGYNWGEGNVQRKGMGAMPAETRGYVAKVLGALGDAVIPTASASSDIPRAPWDAILTPAQGDDWDKISSPVGVSSVAPAKQQGMDFDPADQGGSLSIGPWDTGIATPALVDQVLAGMGRGMVNTLGVFRSPQDVKDDRRLSRPLMQTGAGMAGNALGALAAPVAIMSAPYIAPVAASLRGAALISGALGALQPAESGTEVAENIGLGAAGGAAGTMVGRGLERLLVPAAAANPDNALMAAMGVQPTIGGALGGRANILEQKLRSVPLAGDMIAARRMDARDQFNNWALNHAAEPIGGRAAGAGIGRDAIGDLQAAAGRAYDDAAGLVADVPIGPQAMQAVQGIAGRLQAMPQETENAFNRFVGNNLMRRISPPEQAQPVAIAPGIRSGVAPDALPDVAAAPTQLRATLTQAERQAAARRINVDTDDALTALRKLGGLDMSDPWVGELSGRFAGQRRTGFGLPGAERTGARASEGLDSDRVIETLYNNGYILTPDWHAAEDVLMRSARGERVMSTHGRAFEQAGEDYAAVYAADDAAAMVARGEHPYRHAASTAPVDMHPAAPTGARPVTLDDLERISQAERAAAAEGDGIGAAAVGRVPRAFGLDAAAFKTLDSDIGERIAASSGNRELQDAFRDLQGALRAEAAAANPDYAAALRNADDAYRRLVVIERAANASSVNGGIFTPGQLLAAARAADPRVRHRGFAAGTATMQPEAEAAQRAIGDTYPDSGTAGRSALQVLAATLTGALGGAYAPGPTGATLAALGAGAGLYTRPAQNALVAALTRRPGGAAAWAQLARRATPAIGVPLGATQAMQVNQR